MSEFKKANADAFMATVTETGDSDTLWIVQPIMTEYDGTDHVPIKTKAVNGITPNIGDTVLILTNRNNLDMEKISRFYEANEANGMLVAIIKTTGDYTLTGNYNFIGNMSIDGNLSVDGDVDITGTLTIAGIEFMGHNHLAGAALISNTPGNPVTGVTGGVVP